MKKVLLFLLLAGSGAFAQKRDSLDIKIGQMLLIGYPGPELDSTLLQEVKEGKVGSIILFEKNVPKTATAFNALKKVLWTYQKAAPLPLLITIDQEGGRVNRLKDKYGFPKSITAQASGKAKSLDSVRFNAESIASNLSGLGFNVNFAPCVDVAVNPTNPVIVKSGRSFSANPDSVTMLAREYIIPHRKYNVITVLKHFPGHGSSQDDTHFGVADVTRTWTADELKPYKELLQAGYVDAVMSAHIVNKNLDPRGYPGTLSNRILDSLLRKVIGYNGVVFSDDMQMHAISKQYGLEESIKLAINAGIDILCFSNNIQNTEQRNVDIVHGVIRKMVLSGDIKPERIDQSYRRIMKLKARLNTSQAELEMYQQLAAREKLRADQLQMKVDELQAQAADDGKKKKKKKKRS
ncbi:MAG TPA: glycoside hydrolase family 3 N-terminal domain-containing protein [Cyclobacteriaceae bacterium]|nr:glycoside hydrolase family 3 N-terminal domain-containing protein [Cyclobacteriaceae bacterium]